MEVGTVALLVVWISISHATGNADYYCLDGVSKLQSYNITDQVEDIVTYRLPQEVLVHAYNIIAVVITTGSNLTFVNTTTGNATTLHSMNATNTTNIYDMEEVSMVPLLGATISDNLAESPTMNSTLLDTNTTPNGISNTSLDNEIITSVTHFFHDNWPIVVGAVVPSTFLIIAFFTTIAILCWRLKHPRQPHYSGKNGKKPKPMPRQRQLHSTGLLPQTSPSCTSNQALFSQPTQPPNVITSSPSATSRKPGGEKWRPIIPPKTISHSSLASGQTNETHDRSNSRMSSLVSTTTIAIGQLRNLKSHFKKSDNAIQNQNTAIELDRVEAASSTEEIESETPSNYSWPVIIDQIASETVEDNTTDDMDESGNYAKPFSSTALIQNNDGVACCGENITTLRNEAYLPSVWSDSIDTIEEDLGKSDEHMVPYHSYDEPFKYLSRK